MFTFKLTRLPEQATNESIALRVRTLLNGKVDAIFVSAGAIGKAAVVQVQTNMILADAKRKLRQGRFHQMRVTVENLSHSVDAAGTTANGISDKSAPRKEKVNPRKLATRFHQYLNSNSEILRRSADRDELGTIFHEFLTQKIQMKPSSRKNRKSLEFVVLDQLRRQKLLRTKRIGNKTLVTIAGMKGAGDFPSKPAIERNRQRVLQNLTSECANKEGVEVTDPSLENAIVEPNDLLKLCFTVKSRDQRVALTAVNITGRGNNAFSVLNRKFPVIMSTDHQCCICFKPKNVGVYKCVVRMTFKSSIQKTFLITRYLRAKSGDPEIEKILKPVAPYQPKKKINNKQRPREIIDPPKENGKNGPNPFKKISFYDIPRDVETLISTGELREMFEKPELNLDTYTAFWKHVVWASEFQAREDVKLFDMEKVKLKREGVFMVMEVPGLAEGRPSVLRGDMVDITWKNRIYRGRVHTTRLLEVLLQFHRSFHASFAPAVDRVDVRFSFSRTVYRTSHHCLENVVSNMGAMMLLPMLSHFDATAAAMRGRDFSSPLKLANTNLNDEQQLFVESILRGSCRPMPNLLFGPPGTGKVRRNVNAPVRHQSANPSADDDNHRSNLSACTPSKQAKHFACGAQQRCVRCFRRKTLIVLSTIRNAQDLGI